MAVAAASHTSVWSRRCRRASQRCTAGALRPARLPVLEDDAAATSTSSPSARACSRRVDLFTLSVGAVLNFSAAVASSARSAIPLRRSDGSVSKDHANIVCPRCEPLTELARRGEQGRWVTRRLEVRWQRQRRLSSTRWQQREDTAQWFRSDRPTAPSLGPVWTETLATPADETEASSQPSRGACETMRRRCRSAAADRRRATAGSSRTSTRGDLGQTRCRPAWAARTAVAPGPLDRHSCHPYCLGAGVESDGWPGDRVKPAAADACHVSRDRSPARRTSRPVVSGAVSRTAPGFSPLGGGGMDAPAGRGPNVRRAVSSLQAQHFGGG